ncbi:hypothetical protein [Fulvivirga kasyanovii]|uniref:Uncharacterized protein n=1 Tax=Fulvivirga kasyanovii TaxID=396812 RepID=A0ABW9RQ23_9BACT|nr:hypothetical protein [Fulvivirga kasyanovii]MTI26259.1 hypothetical protein [Fulvivirga kasyanovii]
MKDNLTPSNNAFGKLLSIAILISFFACHSKVRTSEDGNTSPVALISVDTIIKSTQKDSFTINKPSSTDTIPTTNLSLDSSLYPLLPHLSDQQVILRKKSQKNTDHPFVPDSKYTHGVFDQGAIDLILNSINGEPQYLYGQAGTEGDELEFLVYSMTSRQLDQYKAGHTYRIYWAETICLMEPFDHGYQRCYIVYRIEP